jgi:hypothetical protein
VQRFSSSQNHRSHVETLQYLLARAVGVANRITLDEMVAHLASLQLPYSGSVPEFQNNVLGPLKAAGTLTTLVYPGPQGGLFIPTSEREIRRPSLHVLSRIESEVENLIGMRGATHIGDGVTVPDLDALLSHISNLKQVCESNQ